MEMGPIQCEKEVQCNLKKRLKVQILPLIEMMPSSGAQLEKNVMNALSGVGAQVN